MSAVSSSSQATLHLGVRAVQQEELSSVASLIKIWKEKTEQIFNANVQSKNLSPLHSHLFMCERVSAILNSLSLRFDDVIREVWICYDEAQDFKVLSSDGLKGILILKYKAGSSEENSIEVVSLLSNPDNLGLGQSKQVIKGVGSLLIEKSKQRCIEGGFESITLVPTQKACGFYKKMGFEPKDQLELFLTASKIKENIGSRFVENAA